MGICYLCESNISIIDIILQKRGNITIEGIKPGEVHNDCFTLYNKHGIDYFIIRQYLEYNQSLSEYDLTRILNLIDKKSTSRKNIAKYLGFKYKHVKEFCNFLVAKKRIVERIDVSKLPKSDIPTSPKISKKI